MVTAGNFRIFFQNLFSSKPKEEDRDLVINFAYRYALSGVIFSGHIIVKLDLSQESIDKRKNILNRETLENWIKIQLDCGVRRNKIKIAHCMRRARYGNISLFLKSYLEPELAKVDVELVQIVINE